MRRNRKHEKIDYHNIVISELGINPFHMIKSSFALMGIIPLLVIFYILIGKHFLYHLFLGNDGTAITIGIFISIMGYLYAYAHILRMVERLLSYSAERKRADDEKSAFVANVSHEFKNPLGIIKESLVIILDGIYGKINSKQREFLETGKRNIERLIRLVTDLLDISKIEAGKMEMRWEKIDMTPLVNEIITTYERELSKKQLILKKEIPQDIGSIRADKDKISEVVINLLSNAIKYTPPEGNITIRLVGTEKEIRFEISNTGSGIPKESLNKVFNKFERITTEKREGTGLGLPIAKDIVELHKGRIWLESESGKGSKFTFVLPKNLS